MLITFVGLYLALTITIGLLAARRVHGAKDFLVAGRRLPLYMNVATVFATWFGAETVLSVSATFAKDGLNGIPGDPFGASVCLVLAALLFARLFYRMNLLTIGDFYRQRYGKGVEVLTSIAIVLSYLGWTSAQMTALGLVITTLSGGAIDLNTGIMIGAAVVLIYTVFGGMWSVAFTDLFQTVVILIGLTLVAMLVGDLAGGADKVLAQAAADGKLMMFPADMDAAAWWAMAGAFFAFAFGSMPQQDVFQRMTSAKDEKTAVRGTIIGGAGVFLLRLRADLHRLRGAGGRPVDGRAVRCRGRARHPAHPARPGARQDAAVGAGDVLRRAAVGHPVHRQRRAAGADRRCSPRTCCGRSCRT